MKLKLIGFSLLCCIFHWQSLRAQSVEKGRELGEMVRIMTTFHDAPFLHFQTQMIVEDSNNYVILPIAPLPSSTPLSSSASDTVSSEYRMSDGRYWIMMDSTEYVQGYNYNLAIYHDEKIIAVGKPTPQNPAFQLGILDSAFQQAHVTSTVITEVDSTYRLFKLEFAPEAPYSGYELTYNKFNHRISSVMYYLKNGYERSDSTMGTARITMHFFNYSTAEFSRNYFLEEKFITRNNQEFTVRPAYSGYQVIPTADF